MTHYLISIASDNQWGADWEKRNVKENGIWKPYQGYDQLNSIIEIDIDLLSPKFIDFLKSKIKKLITDSAYKDAYNDKLSLLDNKCYKFVLINNVGEHGTSVCKECIELAGCNEFAHIDEITDIHNVDALKQMNRLYICPKELTKTTFINRNFPAQAVHIDLSTYKGVK